MSRISTVALQWLAVAGFVVNVCAYSPIQLVRDAHNIPHLKESVFATRTNSFHAANDDLEQYTISIIILPIILGALGCISLYIYQTILCCRACGLCTCRKDHEFGMDDENKCCEGCKGDCCPSWSYTNISVAFALLLFAAAACNAFVYIGDSQLKTSFADASDSLFTLSDIFEAISDTGTAISNRGNILLVIANSSQCEDTFSNSDEQQFTDGAETIIDAGDDIADQVGALPDECDNYGNDIETKADDRRVLVVNIYFAVIMAVIFFYGIAPCFKSKAYLAFWTVIVELIVLTLTIVAVVQMILITVLGDFCMDPTDNILYTVDDSQSYYDILDHYLTCDGSTRNPFQGTLIRIVVRICRILWLTVLYVGACLRICVSGCTPDYRSCLQSVISVLEECVWLYRYFLRVFIVCSLASLSHFLSADDIDNATTAIDELNQTLVQYEAVNGPNECTTNVSQQLLILDRQLTTLEDNIQCEPVYDVYEDAVLKSVCRSGFRGLFVIWLTQWCTAGLLFFSLMVGASWFHFFNPDWDPSNAKEEEEKEVSPFAR
jgi:hypothetical protein